MRLLTLIAILAVVGIMVLNDLAEKSVEMVNVAGKTADIANARQLRLALELYYADNGYYPAAKNGQQLIDLLHNNNYIGNLPQEADIFRYMQVADGQNYELELK